MKNPEFPIINHKKNNSRSGYVLITTAVLMSVLLLYSISLVSLAMSSRNVEKQENFDVITTAIADAGIQKALWCLNQTSGENCGGTYGGGYEGENNIEFGGGILDISVYSISGSIKQIEASAYYPNKTKTFGKSIIRAKAAISTDKASFTYGMQVGYGGISLGNGAQINGSVYSAGDITGGNGAQINGDAYVAGGTALEADQLWSEKNSNFDFGKTNPQIDVAQSFVPSETNVINKISVYIKKTGSPSSIAIKITADDGGVPGAVISSTSLSQSLVGTNYGWVDASFSEPPPVYAGTKYWLILDVSQSNTKYYTIGIDSFDGYAAGTMIYSQNWSAGNWTASGYDANFKIWLGGIETKIDNIIVGGNAFAPLIDDSTIYGSAFATRIMDSTVEQNIFADNTEHTTVNGSATTTNISSSTVGGDLWCQTRSGTTVGGNIFCPYDITPPSPPGPATMPLSDSIIAEWKADAESGGTVGSQVISANASMGPKKIIGDLTIETGKQLTLTGTLYVTGNIYIGNSGAGISLSPSYGLSSGIVIADGTISIGNEAVFNGTGEGSYLMLLSTKNSSMETAIEVGNTFNGAIFYAPYGIINLGNNATFKEVCAYKLNIGNGLILNYELGMDDISFSSGPSGGWAELPGSWVLVE